MRSVTGRLARCEACMALTFVEELAERTPARLRLNGLSSFAPDGLLRDRYRLLEQLGEGSQGITFLSEHVYLNYPCVLKVLRRRVQHADDLAVQRLRNEARTGLRVNSPHVVRVLDCDVFDGRWYFVMDFVDGGDLARMVERHLTIPWQQAVTLAQHAAEGLAAIHRAGLVHQDIKPSNLLLGCDGELRIGDLGVARLRTERSERGEYGTRERDGTICYVAPEVYQAGSDPGPAADLYSLGVCFFELMTGARPHSASSLFQRLIDLQCRAVTWPAGQADSVPAWLREVVLRLLRIDPRERFESAEALAQRLRQGISQTPVTPWACVPATEIFQPRGVGMLPFENRGESRDDDWLGMAISTAVARALARQSGVFVVDQEGLTPALSRPDLRRHVSETERLLEAGRLVGAATLIRGHFVRSGENIRLQVEVLRASPPGFEALETIAGPLSRLVELESDLTQLLTRRLDLPRPSANPAVTRAPLAAAQEPYVFARQAFLRGLYADAIRWAHEALALDPEFAEAVGFIGVCLSRMGQYAEAQRQHERLESLARQRQDQRLLAEAHANLGVMNYYRGEYAAAHDYYQSAAQAIGGLGLSVELAQINNNLGFVLFRLGRPRDAEAAFLRAIETHRAFGAMLSLIGPYSGLGNVLLDQRRYAEARTYYEKALSLAQEINDRTNIGTSHMHLGNCAVQQGDFALAKREYALALNALEETSFWNGLARVYEHVADLNQRLGNFDEAIRCSQRRIDLARQHKNRRMESAGWTQMAAAYKMLGRETEAAACVAQAGAGEARA